MSVRTRFAPSPTGYLHIGGARTALFSWAYARRHGGKFVLRIEDTDTERSTKESVDAILDSMKWLGLDWDEGPVHQMHRLARYQEVAQQLIAGGHAYLDYMSREELEKRRQEQLARGLKPKFDRRWKPEMPRAEKPVVRFKTPEEGEAGWNDLVKGPVAIPNAELDDLVLLRADGVPTYNFGVVVDDIDMGITHVIRGDDHVNNTPRQIHIFNALQKGLPFFAHVPMILGHDGERLSKRHGATSVLEYRNAGFLPQALTNYLARLGWSHGDDEMFSMQQFVQWFDLTHVSRSAARFDAEKLGWLNHEHIKQTGAAELARLLGTPGPLTEKVIGLVKERARNLPELRVQVRLFQSEPKQATVELAADVRSALVSLQTAFSGLKWERPEINRAIQDAVKSNQLKMPQIAMPLRLILLGETQTPSIDAVIEVLGRETVLARMRRHLDPG